MLAVNRLLPIRNNEGEVVQRALGLFLGGMGGNWGGGDGGMGWQPHS